MLVCGLLKSCNKFSKRAYLKVKAFLFWNAGLRLILESYAPIMQQECARIEQQYGSSNLYTALYWLDRTEFLFYLLIPFVLTVHLYRNYDKIRKVSFRSKFVDAIETLSLRKKTSVFYLAVFCYRRLLTAVIVVSLASAPYWQVMLSVFLI